MAVPLKDPHNLHHHPSTGYNCVARNLIARIIYVLFPLIILHFYFFSAPLQSPPSFPDPPIHYNLQQHRQEESSPTTTTVPSLQDCDYFDGQWVWDDNVTLLYNGTSCSTIKDGQNCMVHGRPDTHYLRWRWQPRTCDLPTFDATTFLHLLRNKHVAFIGDSLARNQLESLLCLLSSASSPELIYRDGDDNKFRRWRLPPPYNATISIYWSPFLVNGVEKSPATGVIHNTLYLDLVDERWASEMDGMDMIVFSIGHWFLHPAIYYHKKGSPSIGCHYCPGLNHTEIEFYDVFRMAIDTALRQVTDHREGKERYVTVTTFSPSHFVGEWDKAGACREKEPFKEGEKVLEGMDAEMRRRQIEAVEAASKKVTAKEKVTIEALDVTRLALMRPDGHPGPYMYPFPFANGVPERVQNDCVHWCMPGPIDTWNHIFLEMVKRWDHHHQHHHRQS